MRLKSAGLDFGDRRGRKRQSFLANEIDRLDIIDYENISFQGKKLDANGAISHSLIN